MTTHSNLALDSLADMCPSLRRLTLIADVCGPSSILDWDMKASCPLLEEVRIAGSSLSTFKKTHSRTLNRLNH